MRQGRTYEGDSYWDAVNADAHLEARVEWLYREAKDIASGNFGCAMEELENPNSEFEHPMMSFEQRKGRIRSTP